MEYRKSGEKYVIRIDKGEEILAAVQSLCRREQITLAEFTGLGAVGDLTAGVFDTGQKTFRGTRWQGDMEITSLIGNVTTLDGEVYLHAHISVADAAGNVKGGHLKSAVVSATAELVLTVMQGGVGRQCSEEIGLNLLKF